MSLIKPLLLWLLNHKSVTTLIMIFIMIITVLAEINIPKKILPEIAPQNIVISSVYPGASTEIIEQTLCIPIENSIRDVENIHNVESTIKNQLCNVVVQLSNDSRINKTLQTIQTNIDDLDNLPISASKPKVTAPAIKVSALRLVVSGDTSIDNLSNIANEVVTELSLLGVTQVTQENKINAETLIEISTENINKHKISLTEVALSIEKNLDDITSGKIKNTNQTIAIETQGTVKNITDLENISLRTYPNGSVLRLRDVATLKHNINLEDHKFFYGGKPAITLFVSQGNIKELSTISNKVTAYIEQKNQQLPSTIKIHTLLDNSLAFNSRMKILGSNGFYGLLLVFIMLSIFLNVRLAIWVTLGIPIAFAGGLLALYLSGGSLNMISTFAFLLILGIIVDDAIVVSESIYTAQQKYGPGKESVIRGIDSVFKPVIYAVTTTMIMFIPLWFIPGGEGKLFSSIPLIATAALIFSLLECFLILPAHLNFSTETKNQKPVQKIQSVIQGRIVPVFERFLKTALNWRYSVITLFLMIFLLCASLLAGGWIKARFISTIETDEVFVKLEIPDGMPRSVLKKYIRTIEDSSDELKQELISQHNIDEIKPVLTLLDIFGPNTASVMMSLPRNNNAISSEAVASLWREKVGTLELASHLEFIATFNKPGPNIKIQLNSESQNALHRAATDLKTFLNQYPEIYGVESTIRKGAQEVNIELKDIASNYNISSQDIALLVNQSFYGIHISKHTNYQSDIIIRLPSDERNTVWHLEQLLIPTQTGQPIRLGQIANLKFQASDTEVKRTNFKRTLEVNGYVNEQEASSDNVFESIKDMFLNTLPTTHPGVSWEKAGALKIKETTRNAFVVSTIIAMFAMYFLLVILYSSLAKPLIVLSAIPFGVVGALVGHWLFGLDLTIWSFSGIAAVSGIVINDNVVLISTINDEIKKGSSSIRDAISSATTQRFRPILLTSVTTIVGVTPIIFEQSLEAQFLIPMAISIAFGEFFATIVSLFLVPCIYMLYEDFNNLLTTKRSQ